VLILVILATQEAEIRRIEVQSQPGQIVRKTLSQKNLHKHRAGGVAQDKGPEFKPLYHKKKKKLGKRNTKGSMVGPRWKPEDKRMYSCSLGALKPMINE
jgi:hypothetical protein